MHEGMKACMNCGVCTAVCPAAEFYNYDPRQIVSTVQTQDDEAIEALLRSETIWYCGECMSCRPRCPRGNTPGLCGAGTAQPFPKARVLHRVGERTAAVRAETAHRRKHPENGVLHHAASGESRHASGAGVPCGSGCTTTTAKCSGASIPPTCRRGRGLCGVSTNGRWRSCGASSRRRAAWSFSTASER